MAVCEFIVLLISLSFFFLSFLTSIILLKYYDTILYTKKNIVFYLKSTPCLRSGLWHYGSCKLILISYHSSFVCDLDIFP